MATVLTLHRSADPVELQRLEAEAEVALRALADALQRDDALFSPAGALRVALMLRRRRRELRERRELLKARSFITETGA